MICNGVPLLGNYIVSLPYILEKILNSSYSCTLLQNWIKYHRRKIFILHWLKAFWYFNGIGYHRVLLDCHSCSYTHWKVKARLVGILNWNVNRRCIEMEGIFHSLHMFISLYSVLLSLPFNLSWCSNCKWKKRKLFTCIDVRLACFWLLLLSWQLNKTNSIWCIV